MTYTTRNMSYSFQMNIDWATEINLFGEHVEREEAEVSWQRLFKYVHAPSARWIRSISSEILFFLLVLLKKMLFGSRVHSTKVRWITNKFPYTKQSERNSETR